MQASHFPTLDHLAHLFTAKLLRFLDEKLTSPLALSATSPPKSSKTRATENLQIFRGQVWSLSHTYTNEIQDHFSLSAQPSSMFPSAAYPPLPLSWQHYSPRLAKPWSQNRVLEVCFRSRSSRIIDPLHRPPQEARFNPTLRQNWMPRTKRTVLWLASGFISFAASASRLSTQSSRGWNDLDPNSRVVTQVPYKEE